ncbi:MAG TPA: hypothetical protein VGR81_00545 [Candidatus Acidoferrales bacterium]|nr:hypothetical protein [Candidatus Acidoferrales bacterium]
MKRSGAVTAAAVVMFIGSALLLLMTAVMLLGGLVAQFSAQLPQEQRGLEIMVAAMYALGMIWGVATGIGVLQLRPWARISAIVMSVLAIGFSCMGILGAAIVPRIMESQPNVPAQFVELGVIIAVVGMLIPLGIAIWWLILFTRKRVILEFSTRGAAPLASPPVAIADPRTFPADKGTPP